MGAGQIETNISYVGQKGNIEGNIFAIVTNIVAVSRNMLFQRQLVAPAPLGTSAHFVNC